jgi:cobalt-zinc-cadmium efflux system membrane fusion protein
MNKILILFFVIIFSACNNSGSSDQETVHSDRGPDKNHKRGFRGRHAAAEPFNIFSSGDTVFVPAGAAVNSKLALYTVEFREYNAELNTTGVVKPISGHLAELTSPFEGRVVKSFIKLGQKVNTGTPLFEVSSPDYLETVRMFFQSKREKEMTEKNYLRKMDLLEAGIISKREFDEAKLEFDLAKKELEKALAILKIHNLDSGEADMLQPLIIRSPIPGEIVRNDITVGQYIKADSDPIVTVADLNRIWVVARVREKDLSALTFQDQVEIFTESLPYNPVKGVVKYIGSIMNEQTRSVEVFIECENKNQVFKSGMFVSVRFYHEMENAIIIPASSVLQDYNNCVLFIKAGPDIYIKKRVEVTSIADKKLIVHSGLETGNIIVSEGAIYLR